MRAALLYLLVYAWSVVPLFAGQPDSDIGVRARGAQKIVLARVASVQSRFDTNSFGDQLIVSDLVVHVEEALKGTFDSTLLVTVEGGTVGDLTLEVSDMPDVRQGDRALFLLEEAPGQGLRPRGGGLGVLKMDGSNRVVGSGMTLAQLRRAISEAGR